LFDTRVTFCRRRTGGSGSSGEDSDLSEEETTTRSLTSSHSDHDDDDFSLSEDDDGELYFTDSEDDEEGDDVVVEEEEEVGKSVESLVAAAQATALLPALWLACIWLRAQPEVLAGTVHATFTSFRVKNLEFRSSKKSGSGFLMAACQAA
jgi:predicted DCC family thiol-disulfide oxidoreductase YuxK